MQFSDLSLAQRLEQADAARYADYAHARPNVVPDLNPAVLPLAGGTVIYAGANSPFSRAIGLGLHGPVAEAEFAHMEAFYCSRNVSPKLSLCPLADHSLLELLSKPRKLPVTLRACYDIEMFMHVWRRTLTPGEVFPPPSPDIVIRPILPTEIDLWVRTAFGGGINSDDAVPHHTAIIAAYPYMARTTCYLAWVEGQPAGAATLASHDRVANLFGASTHPRFRNRGVQQALLAARLADATASGCNLAMTHTEPGSPSQRNVERLGFHLAYTKVLMVRRQ